MFFLFPRFGHEVLSTTLACPCVCTKGDVANGNLAFFLSLHLYASHWSVQGIESRHCTIPKNYGEVLVYVSVEVAVQAAVVRFHPDLLIHNEPVRFAHVCACTPTTKVIEFLCFDTTAVLLFCAAGSLCCCTRAKEKPFLSVGDNSLRMQ